jgi:hypothetical protein
MAETMDADRRSAGASHEFYEGARRVGDGHHNIHGVGSADDDRLTGSSNLACEADGFGDRSVERKTIGRPRHMAVLSSQLLCHESAAAS